MYREHCAGTLSMRSDKWASSCRLHSQKTWTPNDTLDDATDIEQHFDGRMGKTLEKNPYATLIYAVFRSLTSVSAFNSAYIEELMDDDDLGPTGRNSTAASSSTACSRAKADDSCAFQRLYIFA
jgi:hypothetical protein